MWPRWTDAGAPRALLLAALAATLATTLAACGGPAARPDPAAAVAAGPDPAAQARYGEALAALQAGDAAQAEAGLQALVEQYPQYAGPMVNLALLRARRGELAPASGLLEKAVTVCANCAPSWNALGVVQRQQGRFAEAEQSYLKAIAADGGYANAYFNLGVLYELYLQRPDMALEQYAQFRERVVADDPAGGDVDKWIADLKRRSKSVERSAQVEVTAP
jgi:tetratricopeptide (TPR) repeat protein